MRVEHVDALHAVMSHHSLDSLDSCTDPLSDRPALSPLAIASKARLRSNAKASQSRSDLNRAPLTPHSESTSSSLAHFGGDGDCASPSVQDSAHAHAIGSLALASEDEADIYQAQPLFARPLTAKSVLKDSLVFVWAYLCHMLLTAWPYLSLVILAGALQATSFLQC